MEDHFSTDMKAVREQARQYLEEVLFSQKERQCKTLTAERVPRMLEGN